MGEHVEDRAISRREAIKLSAKVAGVAAFATPVVVGAFSAPALGQATCDPATDSDAVEIESAAGEKWNTNCQLETDNEPEESPLNSPYGRYNSQRSEFASDIGTVAIVFGWGDNTDNFRTDQSWYTIEAPANYQCSATWAISKGGPRTTDQGCEYHTRPLPLSDPPDEIVVGDEESLYNSAPGALPLPYCAYADVNPDVCNNDFLELVRLVCCFN